MILYLAFIRTESEHTIPKILKQRTSY